MKLKFSKHLRSVEINLCLFLARIFNKSLLRAINSQLDRKIAIVSIHNRLTNGNEDRVKVYFKLLSEADVGEKFIDISVRRNVPSFFYLFRLIYLYSKFDLRVILIDYSHSTRFPNLELVRILKNKIKFSCIWFETFEEKTIRERIMPTLEVIETHFIADDPSLRIANYEIIRNYQTSFVFFPFPVFPKRKFHEYNEDEKLNEICFFGVIDSSIGHSGRRNYLDELENHGQKITGYVSSPNLKQLRPSYDEMLSDMRKSRIGLNFSNHGGIGAVTNRVIETIASGAVLFSTNEEVLKRLLTPGQDYIVFEDPKSLLNAIDSLKNDTLALNQMSQSAIHKIRDHYSAESFVANLR